MSDGRTLCRIHLTTKPQFREVSQQYFANLNPDERQHVEMRFRQLFDADLIQSSKINAVEAEVISPDQLEAILSKMCYGLPATATIEEVKKAQSAADNAAIARKTAGGMKDLKTKLRDAQLKMERKPEEKF